MVILLPRSVAFGKSKTGLASVGLTLLNPDGSEHTARTTTDIYEMEGGGYGKNISFSDNWKGILKWDSGEPSPIYAYEDYNYLTLTGGNVGTGSLSCIWTQKTEGGIPIDAVRVWISDDIEGTNIIAGTLLTNANGEVTFMLDTGTVYVWRQKTGYSFSNPQTWSVT
jgi:hypothetical protein